MGTEAYYYVFVSLVAAAPDCTPVSSHGDICDALSVALVVNAVSARMDGTSLSNIDPRLHYRINTHMLYAMAAAARGLVPLARHRYEMKADGTTKMKIQRANITTGKHYVHKRVDSNGAHSDCIRRVASCKRHVPDSPPNFGRTDRRGPEACPSHMEGPDGGCLRVCRIRRITLSSTSGTALWAPWLLRAMNSSPTSLALVSRNLVLAQVDFDVDSREYADAISAVLQELDCIALSASAHRKDVPPAPIRSSESYQKMYGETVAESDYNNRADAAKIRLQRLSTGQLLTTKDARFLDPYRCIPSISWRDNILANTKDKAMMCNSVMMYKDWKNPIPFKHKNKLANVCLGEYCKEDLDLMVEEHMESPVVCTDVKPENAKAGDGKRLFYETQLGAWVAFSEVEESIGQAFQSISGYVQGKSSAKVSRLFEQFTEPEGDIP
eukprot:2676043-Amphidinium_carterae.1